VIQALDRTQPMLPMKPGQVERHSRDDQRNGTTSLFAALEVATGRVTNQATVRHRPEEFLDFLNLLVRTYPRRQIHVVLDNVSSHKTPEVQPWLRRHKRFHFHFHFTPTSASWMNQIETWAGILTRQALRRGTFDRVKALVAMIEAFTRSWNEGASPFMWVKTADEILAKAVRKPRVTSESGH
jgi:transposase